MSCRGLFLGACVLLLLLSGCGKNASKPGAGSVGDQSGRIGSAGDQSGRITSTVTPTRARGGATSPTPGSGGPELPATFTLGPGGALAPPVISGPAGVRVQLVIDSKDSRPHRVTIRAPHPRSLSLGAHGRASADLGSPGEGSYPVFVDGKARGHLVIGVAPGP